VMPIFTCPYLPIFTVNMGIFKPHSPLDIAYLVYILGPLAWCNS